MDDAQLDRLLAKAAAEPPVPAALERRVLADFDRHAPRWKLARALRRAADAVWPDAPLWQPACAFGLALMIGLGVAAFAPLDLGENDEPGTPATFALDTAPAADADAVQGI